MSSNESFSGSDARSGGFSAGHAPRGLVWARAVLRSRSADPDGVRQMGAFAPAVTASLSRARNVRDCDPAAILRACLSLISSDMSIRTALGRNISRSRHRRLAKAVRSAVSPCLTTATVLPSGERDGGVHGHGAVPSEADRVCGVGDRGGKPIDDG